MSQSVEVSFVHSWQRVVQHLAQQATSKLQQAVRVKTTVGKTENFERLAATAAVKRTARHSKTPTIEVPHSRRRAELEDYDWAALIDNVDELKMLLSLDSEYNQNAAMALSRTKDDVIIAAFNAAAKSVAADDTTSTVALPGAQIIGAGGAGMTVAKWRQAKDKMDEADVPEEDRFIVLSPTAINQDLLADSNVTNQDYNTVRALVGGEIPAFLGMTVIKTTRLPKAGNIRSCFAFQRTGMGLAIGKDMTFRMSERDDLNYATQIYGCLSLGAVRIEEVKVVQIDIDESV